MASINYLNTIINLHLPYISVIFDKDLTKGKTMIIGVGSKSAVMACVVRTLAPKYDLLRDTNVYHIDILDEVPYESGSINEVIRDAQNRAKTALLEGCDLGFGLKEGFIRITDNKKSILYYVVCAIYNGSKYAVGISPSFECPPAVARLVRKGVDINEAFLKRNKTKNPKDSGKGAVGLLTKGRLTKLDFVEQAIIMAMPKLELPKFYK